MLSIDPEDSHVLPLIGTRKQVGHRVTTSHIAIDIFSLAELKSPAKILPVRGSRRDPAMQTIEEANMSPHQVIIHQDDVGMSHGANVAFLKLFEAGICTAGSVMVPCPWFPEIAQIARNNPELDLGVHLTLNSDMGPYKWRPLTGIASNGLTDTQGYFWDNVPDLRRNADPVAVEAELQAQVQCALDAGIAVTHLDCHMGAAMMPEFVEVYERLGAEFDLPLLLMKDYRTFSVMSYVGPVTTGEYEQAKARATARGNLVVDLQLETVWDWPDGVDAAYRRLFSQVPHGTSWLALHFTAPGEIELFDDEAQIRVGEYDFFKSGGARRLLDEFNLTAIGVREWLLQERVSRR